MQLPERAEGGIATAMLGGARRPAAWHGSLVIAVEEGDTGDLDAHRGSEVAAQIQLRRVHKSSERRPSLAVDFAVSLRRDLGDDARRDGGGRLLGQLDVP